MQYDHLLFFFCWYLLQLLSLIFSTLCNLSSAPRAFRSSSTTQSIFSSVLLWVFFFVDSITIPFHLFLSLFFIMWTNHWLYSWDLDKTCHYLTGVFCNLTLFKRLLAAVVNFWKSNGNLNLFFIFILQQDSLIWLFILCLIFFTINFRFLLV